MRHLSKLAWPTVLGVLALAGGCSTLDVPRADSFPITGQMKARAVHHWDVLAQDVAARIANKISDWPAGEHPIYVEAASDSSFQHGFRKLLVARMLDRGIVLATDPAAVQLQVETQVVQHGQAFDNHVPPPGARLASGVAVARDMGLPERNNVSGVAAGRTLRAPLEVSPLHTDGAAAGGTMRTEVLVTTTLVSGGRYLASTSDIYYIEQAETVLYQSVRAAPPPNVKQWQVVLP